MNKRHILLIIVVIAIAAAILWLEQDRPEYGEVGDVDIKAEEIRTSEASDNSAGDAPAYPTEVDLERIELKADEYERAKEVVEPEGYINTNDFLVADNVGKNVVLVDFWTYSCINCQRTQPYLNAWHDKYNNKGLVIVGVHTPEFEFEKDYKNLKKAVEEAGIKYPVVQDNDKQTWRAYKNRFWPRKYLIDIDGFIVYDHIGEGAYEEIELKIQEALKERAEVLGIEAEIGNETAASGIAAEKKQPRTAETYFGYGYEREQMGNEHGWKPDEIVSYTIPNKIEGGKFYLEGEWRNNYDDMELVSEKGSLEMLYTAKSVNLVAGADSSEVKIFLNGKEKGSITVNDYGLHKIIDEEQYGENLLRLEFEKGVRIYTFTFG